MERVSGLDASFLAFETPTMMLHVSAVMVFDPSDDGGDAETPFFERVRRLVERRLPLVPPLRRRAVRVPFGLHHPVWVDDPHFELEAHLRRASLPTPGGPRELAQLVADIAARPLDDRRPLWEMHVVEGLESGHVALVAKLHHAIIDGTSGAELLAAFFDVGPAEREALQPAEPWCPRMLPSDGDLLAGALSSLVHQPERAVSAVRRTMGAVRDLAERNRRLREEDDTEPPPAPFRAPRTSLNGALSSQRRFGFAHVPLGDLRAVGHVFGATVNDVVLAAVSGALRRRLVDGGELPDNPLVAIVPISTRAGTDSGELGNRVHAMLVSLATTEADPVVRLRAIAAGSRLAKEQASVLSEDLVRQWAQLAVPAVATRLARLATNLRIFDRLPAPANVLVSNIVGPEIPLWCAGARLVALYPVGPLAEGVGLNVTVISYAETLYLGLLGCRSLVPDLDQVVHHLTDAFAELVKMAVRSGAGGRENAGSHHPGPRARGG